MLTKTIMNATVFLPHFLIFLAGTEESPQRYYHLLLVALHLKALPPGCSAAPRLEVSSSFVWLSTFFVASKFPLNASKPLCYFWPFAGPQSWFRFGGNSTAKNPFCASHLVWTGFSILLFSTCPFWNVSYWDWSHMWNTWYCIYWNIWWQSNFKNKNIVPVCWLLDAF